VPADLHAPRSARPDLAATLHAACATALTRAALAGALPLLLAALPAGAGTWRPAGPDGGTVLALAAAAAAPQRVFAGAQDGGVFRSIDGGRSWSPLTAALPVPSVTALAVDPGDADHVLAAADGAVFGSLDAGASWQAASPGFDAAVRHLDFAPSDPRVVYAAGGGVWRSGDGGATWLPVDGGLPAGSLTTVAVAPEDPDTAWAAVFEAGIYVTRDGGATWQRTLRAPSPRGVVADPGEPGTVYAAGGDGLYVSRDHGASWHLSRPATVARPSLTALALCPHAPSSLFVVEVAHVGSPLQPFVDRLWRLDDRGSQWTPLHDFDRRVQSVLPGCGDRAPLLAVEGSGVLSGNDGGTAWASSVHGLAARGVAGFAAAASEPSTFYFFSAQTQSVLRSPDGGATWPDERSPGGGGIASPRLVVSPHDATTAYLLEFALYRLRPGGDVRWSSIVPGAVHRSLAIDPADPAHLLAVTDLALPCAPLPCTPERRYQLHASGDGGATWQAVATPGAPLRALTEVVFAPRRPQTAWVAASGASSGGTVLRSRDGGATWTPTGPGLPAAPEHLVVQPVPGGSRLFAIASGAGAGVFTSSDDGDSWQRLAQGLPLDLRPSAVAVASRLAGRVVLGSVAHGVFSLGDDDRWQSLGDGLPALPVDHLEVLPAADVVVASLHGAGSLYRFGVAEDCTGDDPRALCTGAGGRFRVEVAWEDFQGGHGDGVPLPLTAAAGYFWFFSPGNAELAVKVLDGRGLDHHFWVFYGALSNVGFDLAVTDTVGGGLRVYVNRPGRFASRGDTTAFRADGTALGYASRTVAAAVSAPAASVPATATTGCDGDPAELCFFDGRFAVSAEWSDFQGGYGEATPVALAGSSGYLWFFRPDNLELFVKVLDGRPVNGRFWLFYGSLSNVGFTLTVRDRVGGQRRVFHNPPGTFASYGSTTAF